MNDERLQERIARLEQALAAERARAGEAEATLAGLRCIVDADDREAAERGIVAGLRELLHFEHVALVGGEGRQPERLVPRIVDHPRLAQLRWAAGSLRERVLSGQTVALYDVRQHAELAEALADAPLRSLLCVPLSTPERATILLAAHSATSYFTTRHVALARGFAGMAARMLDTLDTRAHAQERHVSEARARTLARTNEQLREQLLTIKTQQHEIQRLRAPILLVAPRTLVVPLVGELDPAALLQVTESLLQALTTHRARTIILDLSAFESTQVGVAERLTALARTTGSLGARCMLCGLRPALAVSLAAEGSMDLQTFATLACALASAT
jgi:rsbT co-antagonist protein RsbR